MTTKAKALKTEHETRKSRVRPLVSRLITRAHTSSGHLHVQDISPLNECRVCVFINRRSENRKTLYRGDRTMAVRSRRLYTYLYVRRGSE